jgi:hypothetical protein
MVRRATGEVFVWTEQLAKRKDLEEVVADSPAEAVKKPATLDPRRVSIEQIESLPKDELLVFARLKLGLVLDESMSKPQMQDAVKEALLTMPSPGGAMKVATEVGPFATAKEAAKRPGDKPAIPPAPGKAVANG